MTITYVILSPGFVLTHKYLFTESSDNPQTPPYFLIYYRPLPPVSTPPPSTNFLLVGFIHKKCAWISIYIICKIVTHIIITIRTLQNVSSDFVIIRLINKISLD